LNFRKAAGNGLLAALSVAVTLTCSEAYIRHAVPELRAPPADRAFLSAFYEANADGVYTWPPNRRIRYVRTHDGRVEYDVAFESNDLGLVDDTDYVAAPLAARRVALVGDSFTAGYHGGRPWVPELSRRMAAEGVRLYNLGIGGAGFPQFESLLRSVSQHVEFTDVVLVAITDDLQRAQWRLDVDEDVARFCLVTWPQWLCRLRPPYFHRIDLETDPSRWTARHRDSLSAPSGLALASVLVQVARASERREEERAKRTAKSERAIESIVETYGPKRVSFIHLPMRGEVERGEYKAGTRELAKRIRSSGVDYFPALRKCSWAGELFFRHDEHPNAAGYARIAECVGDYLRRRLGPPSASPPGGRQADRAS